MREMKDSGIEWIGEIPNDWDVSKIKFVADFEPTCNFENVSPEDRIAYAPMECIKQGFYEARDAQYEELSHSLTPFQDGDIVMAKVTPCFENGNIAIMNELPSGIGLGSSELFVFRAKNIVAKYLFYWLQNSDFIQRACSTMTGVGGLKRVTPFFCKNCEIHIPPYNEQGRIADYLDRKCSQIDAIIARQQEVLEKLKAYKLSIITEAVTKGLNPDVPMKDSGVEWIGEVPEHWDILKLQAHTRMLTPMRDRPEKLDGDIPWVRIEDYDGKYISASKEGLGVSTETVKEMNLKIYPVGSILCTSSCDLGKCAIVTRELVSNQRFINIIPDSNTNSDYLYYLMLSNAERLNHLSTGTIQANLSRKAFEHLMVQFPPISEQKAIAEYLDRKCEAVELSINKKQELIDRLSSYKKSLIYEVVTGKKEV